MHNKKRMDTRSAKSCGMGVSICFFLYIKICHGVIRQNRIILSADTASEVRQLLSQKRRQYFVYWRAFWQRRCRAAAAEAVLKP